jgi:CubicO group peptidase (beta-lactamase class C family)
MKKRMVWIALFLVVLVFVLVLVLRSPYKAGPAAQLGSEMGMISVQSAAQLQQLYEKSGIPSLAVSIVVGEELVWAKGYGEQADLSTVYVTGSIDKAFITTAILQLYEQGLLALDDDVNTYLPFSVRHPDYPDTPITIRMLLTHRAGLPHDLPGTRYLDNDGPMLRWMFWHNGYQFGDLYHAYFPLSPDKYLANVFSQESKYGTDFWVAEPGTQYQYSNSAYYLLLTRVIEAVTGQPYEAYVREAIIAPLGMTNTAYEAHAYPKRQLARPYEDFGSPGRKLPLTGMSASGRLRTNVLDLSQYLLVHVNQGQVGDTQILHPATVEMMHAREVVLSGRDFPPMELAGLGLSWFLWADGYQGHPGASPGYIAQIICRESETVPYGIVILMTYGCSKTECDFAWFDEYYVALRERLFAEAAAIAGQKGE